MHEGRYEPLGVVQMVGITKRFPGVLANDHVNLELNKGEIHGLLGENGAGKTTLMNILFGLYQPDAGQILVRGQPIMVTAPTGYVIVDLLRDAGFAVR